MFERSSWAPAWEEELATELDAVTTWVSEQERISSLTSSLEAQRPGVVHEEDIERINLSVSGA